MGKDSRSEKDSKSSRSSKKDTQNTAWESQQKTLRDHNKKLEEAEKAPHLDSAHIDMSKDGIGKNKHGDPLAELEAREARKADAARAQAERAAERKAEKLSMQHSQSDAAEEARRRQQQRISDAMESTSARAMQQEKLSRVEQFFDSLHESKQDSPAHPHPSASPAYPSTPPSTHPASPAEHSASTTQQPASMAQNPASAISHPTSTPSSENASSHGASTSRPTHAPTQQFTSEKKEVPPSRPSTPYTAPASAHDRQGSTSRSTYERFHGNNGTSQTGSGGSSNVGNAGSNRSTASNSPNHAGSYNSSPNGSTTGNSTSSSRQRWTQSNSGGRSGSNSTSNSSTSRPNGSGSKHNASSGGTSGSGSSHGSGSYRSASGSGASGGSGSGSSRGTSGGAASRSRSSSISTFDRTRARLAKMQQIERITAKPLRIAGSVGMGAVQITRSIAYRKLQETDNDTVKGISYATRYTSQAIALSRAVLTSSPQANFGALARNPLGLNARQDKLDKMLYDKLSKNGKLLSGSDLAKQANIVVRDFERKLEKRVGAELLHASDNQLKSMASKLTAKGKSVKKEINRLQAKGACLSASERKKLLDLKKQSKEIGKNLATVKNAQRAKADLAHLRRRAGDIAKRTQIRRAPKRILKQTATMGVERALMSNEGTQGLAYTLRYATNPTVRKITRGVTRTGARVVVGTGKFAGKTVLRVIGQEDLPMRISRAVQRGKHAIQKTIRKGARAVGRTIANLVPTPIKTATGYVAKAVRKFASIPAGIRNRFYRLQSKLLQNKVSLALRRTSAKIGNAFRAAFSFVKKALAKVALILAGAFLVILLIVVIASSAATVPATIVLAPDTSSMGKIDLTPYARILRSPTTSVNSEVKKLRESYEAQGADVNVYYSGRLNNGKDLLTMLTVRFQQDIDIDENADVKPYLTQMYLQSHEISTTERHWYCSGCLERPKPSLKFDPEQGIFEVTPETEKYCLGHTSVNIVVKTLGLDDLFEKDTYVCTKDGYEWDGWTEENREWAKAIYEQDWSALYVGIGDLQTSVASQYLTSADEFKIWNCLLELADGNAYGAAGAMGNLCAESALRSDNVEDKWSETHGMDDMQYTSGINGGTYPYFTTDGAGYGLAQWTIESRKTIFRDLVNELNTTYDDVDMQLELIRRELTGYYADIGLDFSSICAVMQTATSVQEASDAFLDVYENPKDKSDSVRQDRANLGQSFYNKYTLAAELEGDMTLAQKTVVFVAMHSEDYNVPAQAGYCQRWAAMVYAAAGYPIDTSEGAKQSGLRYGVSSDFSIIPAGAAVYGNSNQYYGHVGIYVGDGLVYHNVGGVVVDTLEDWILTYDGFAWGWEAGTDLTALD